MMPSYPSLRHWPRALLRVLMPSLCALCGSSSDDVVCEACRTAYAAARPVRCGQCANPLPNLLHETADAPGLCGTCLRDPPAYDATVAAVDYAIPLDQLVLQLKFGARLAL